MLKKMNLFQSNVLQGGRTRRQWTKILIRKIKEIDLNQWFICLDSLTQWKIIFRIKSEREINQRYFNPSEVAWDSAYDIEGCWKKTTWSKLINLKRR